MSNDVTTPDGGAPMAAPAKKRRALWVAGVAGLSGVVGLAALGGLAARDDKADGTQRVSEVQSATAQQKASGTGTADVDSGEEEDKKTGQDPGEGYDRQDATAAPGGKQWQGKDDKGKDKGKDKDKDEYGPAKQLPCDSDVLVEAINRANQDNGGVFRLAKDCEYKLTEETDNNAFPAIDERIVLLGHNSKLVHDGSELFRFFEVLSGGELILKDLTLRGGQVTSPPPLTTTANGGALLVQEGGRALLKHTKLVDNRATGVGATGGNGGAIYNLGDVEIHKSVLADNHARGTGTPGGNGGAIYNEGTLAVHDSELANNTATSTGGGGNGGAIANADNGITTVTYSKIVSNKASNDGGGIWSDDDSRLTVTRTKIADNVACDDGGGIYNDGDSAMTLEYVVVSGNKATDDGGGLFHDSNSIATVRHSKFLDNTAGDNGGGIFNGETLNVFDTEFKGNHAEEGGAIYNDGDGVLTVRKSTIVYNFAAEAGSATSGAGGIFNDNGTVTIDDKTVIAKNEPRNCVDVPGCAN
ncbi:right-handed parallel beta-helix repeat-containing protein [Micromonospora coxensis]|uniref:right-handed parallel beta-helix repeat-containing protein n=1 Tax=Micromonospora coxensis TaxID=356852 RepID=UPI0034470141